MHAGDHDVNVAPPGLPNRCSLPLYTFGEDIGHSEGRMAHLTGPLHPVQSNIVGLSRLCDPQAAYLTQCGKLPRLEPGDIIAIYFSADKRWWQGEVKVVVDRAVNQVILRFEERRKSVKIKLESERWIWKRIFAYGKVAERSIAKPLANTKPGATSARPPAAPNAKSTRTSKLPRSANPSGVAPKRKRARKKPAQPGPPPPAADTAGPAAPFEFDKAVALSQLGEDRHLNGQFFKGQRGGVFVEMGALDGLKYSNSYAFEHALGWSGVLIEANPASCAKLFRNRPAPTTLKLCTAVYGTFRLNFHRFDQFELYPRGHTQP